MLPKSSGAECPHHNIPPSSSSIVTAPTEWPHSMLSFTAKEMMGWERETGSWVIHLETGIDDFQQRGFTFRSVVPMAGDQQFFHSINDILPVSDLIEAMTPSITARR